MKNVFEVTEKKHGSMPYIQVDGVDLFDVGRIFDCGQCFRFDPVEGSSHENEFAGVAYGRHVSFAQDGDRLYIYNSDMADYESIWKRYLCLDTDYGEINRDILAHSAGTVMEEAMEYGKGIRILRQEPFEAVISFIVSQNNNIPRIKKIIESMSQSCGAPIEMGEEQRRHVSGRSSLCAFPTCEALLALGEAGLFELRTGFRARYIYDAVSKISDGSLGLDDICGLDDTAACIDRLCGVKGIGLKVASCAALFGFGRYDAFPVDVWMKRVAQKYFPDEAQDFSGARFGKYAGIAQQYLFYYERYHAGKMSED